MFNDLTIKESPSTVTGATSMVIWLKIVHYCLVKLLEKTYISRILIVNKYKGNMF